jgi:hypothetical protein
MPPSVPRVARQLGFKYVSSLYGRFPALCRTLVATRREHERLSKLRVRAALQAALAEEPPPTLKEVAHRLGHKTAGSIALSFPVLCRALVARSQQQHRKQLEQVRSALQAALKEQTPPLKQTLANRTGLTRGYLATLFPGLWRRLGARSREHQKQEAEKRRQMLRQEVREIVGELLTKGTPPTRRLVRSMITRSPIKGGHLIVREIKQAEDEVRRQLLPPIQAGDQRRA